MTTNKELGRLKRVELRDAWQTEAGEFTPWLAAQIKIEKLKINKQDRLLGQTILDAREEEEIFSRETKETIGQVARQRCLIESAKQKCLDFEQAVAELIANINQVLNLSAISDSADLKKQSDMCYQ